MAYRFTSRMRGLGAMNYYDLLAQANLQDCDPKDVTCVASNVAKQAAVEDYWVQHMSTGVPEGTQLSFAPLSQSQVEGFTSPNPIYGGNIVPTGILSVGGVRQTLPPISGQLSPGQQSYSPRVAFSTSRGGTSLVPGDTWQVSISGGAPNTQVTVTGGKAGQNATSAMGTTDASGNFSLSGSITPDQIGSWNEQWAVGGVNAGSFSFTVNAGGSPATTPQGQTIISSSGVTQPVVTPPVSGFSFSSIPWWGWAGGAVVAFFALKGAK
jgi:hypothetical protein